MQPKTYQDIITDFSKADAMEEASGRSILAETIPLIIAGLIQIGLGILKIKKS